jgi:hypothetical protein
METRCENVSCLDLTVSGLGSVMDACENSNELSDVIKGRIFRD